MAYFVRPFEKLVCQRLTTLKLIPSTALKKGVNDNVIADTEIGPLSLELACTYNAGDPIKAKKCPAAMAKIQKKVNSNAKIYGETPRKYVNTPGCHDDDFFSFGERQVFFYS
jgi:hypothetical protein